MDYGDDPLISTLYAPENARAVQMLAPGGARLLDSLRTRHSWYKKSLAELRDHNVLPTMMVAAGMKWPTLQSKYGTAALIDHGFRWEDMLAAGFDGRALRSLTPELITRLGINAARALACRPSVTDLAALGLTVPQLTDMGWTLEALVSMGLDHVNMVKFGLPLSTWVNSFGLSDFSSLGFTSYSACATAGWSDRDIQLALKRPTATARVARRTGELRFV